MKTNLLSKGRQKRRSHELQFLPPALEILETPALPLPWAGSWAIVIIAVAALLWGTLGFVDIVATAQGRIVPSGRSQPIQGVTAGKVERIHVVEGQEVAAGDVLIEFDTRESRAELERMVAERRSFLSDIERITAALAIEKDSLDGELHKALDLESMKPEHAELLQSQISGHIAKLKRVEAQIQENSVSIQMTRQAHAKLTKIRPLVQERVTALEPLVRRGLSPKPSLLEQRQRLIEVAADIKSQTAKLEQLTFVGLQLNQQYEELIAEYRRTLLVELLNVHAHLRGADQMIAVLNKKLDDGVIRAPVGGYVYQLSVTTPGAALQPGGVAMIIVPKDVPVEIEAVLEGKDSGFVAVGQKVEVKIDAYPFTQHGLLEGRVALISADSSAVNLGGMTPDNSKASADEQFRRQGYTIRVELESNSGVFLSGTPYLLKPGMSAIAEIKTGQRRLIQYIFSPLQTKVQEAARER